MDQRRVGGHAVEQAGVGQLPDFGDFGGVGEEFHRTGLADSRAETEAIAGSIHSAGPEAARLPAVRWPFRLARPGSHDCRDKFTVRTGTVMERSHVPLHKWLLATHLMAASKKGMSAKQMERMLGVTYKTAWFLCHRIREAMDGAAGTGPLGGAEQDCRGR